jgi:hypothetical protein
MNCPLCEHSFKATGFRNHLNHCLKKNDLTLRAYMKDHQDILFEPHHALVAKIRNLIRLSPVKFGWQMPCTQIGDMKHRLWHDPYQWSSLKKRWPTSEWSYYTFDAAKKPCPVDYLRSAGAMHQISYRIAESYPLDRGFHSFDLGEKIYGHFKLHFQGKGTLAMVGHSDNRFLCLDIDTCDLKAIQKIVHVLCDEGITIHVEFSGRKGYHLWLFFDEVIDLTP